MKLRNFLLFVSATFVMIACVKEEFSMEDLSKDAVIEREIAMPLIEGDMSFEDIVETASDSMIINGLDTIFLYLITDTEFEDSLSVSDIFGENDWEFDYMNLHLTFTNMFPVGLDVRIFLFDSIAGVNVDTIFFSGARDEIFLDPAPTDNNGLTIENQVQTDRNILSIPSLTLNRLTTNTTHLIFAIKVPATNGMVKILSHYNLDLHIGLEAKGRYFWVIGGEENQ